MRHADLRRIGLIVPAGNMALEWEFSRYLPPGFAFNTARAVRRTDAGLDFASLLEMGDEALPAARSLMRTRPEVILYGCTSGSFIEGSQDIPIRIACETDTHCLTTAGAVLAAHEALGARNVVLITPYPDAVNHAEIAFLKQAGIVVNLCDSLPCDADHPIGAVSDAETMALAFRHADAIREADALFISCTNLLTLDRIATLEARLGRPVISSNLASLWGVLRHLGHDAWRGPNWSLMAAGRS